MGRRRSRKFKKGKHKSATQVGNNLSPRFRIREPTEFLSVRSGLPMEYDVNSHEALMHGKVPSTQDPERTYFPETWLWLLTSVMLARICTNASEIFGIGVLVCNEFDEFVI